MPEHEDRRADSPDAPTGGEARPGRALGVARGAWRLAVWAVVSALWMVGALLVTVLGVGSLLPGFVIGAGVVGLVVFRKRVRWSFGVALALCLAVVVWRSGATPRNDRAWQEQLTVAPTVSIDGATVTIEGVRDFEWRADGSYDARWETRRYGLDKLRAVEMVLEPFSYTPLMAHTMLSFDFGEDGRILLSIEARKEIGETYNPVIGGLNRFELIYLFLDERDAFGVRAHKGHELYSFPVVVDPLRLRAFFLALCTTANNLREAPAFYHIIRDNCTTAWVQQADHLAVRPAGLNIDTVLNGRIARMLHRKGAIDTDLPYEEARERFRIDGRVLESLGDPDFSEAIRAGRL